MYDAATFLERSIRYERLHADPRIACKTNFFAAAALVTRSLAGALPSRFLGELSGLLERANGRRAQEILAGRLYANGRVELNTADFIRYEQALVQAELDGLRQTDAGRYSREIHLANTQLALARGRLARALVDCKFVAALEATARQLGRLDFARQHCRETLGRQIARHAAHEQRLNPRATSP